MNQARAIKIAITAMGGQGGGVLCNWIVQLGEISGFTAQMTSVPGVAQRTGATVYYVELFPMEAAKAAGKDPVLALMPSSGDVDVVIAAELMEAGRAINRGFVGGATTLIASTHRDYAISEKIGLGDARQDAAGILTLADSSSRKFVGADMSKAAAEAGAVISAVLFGALAGSQALSIERAKYEDVIRKMGRAVDANLRGFAKGFDIAQSFASSASDDSPKMVQTIAPSRNVAPLLDRMHNAFPASTHFYVREGLKRTVDFQSIRYAEKYLKRLDQIRLFEETNGGERRGFLLTQMVAKHLALWMTYEDTIRVADLKTRKGRFRRFREDVRADEEQIVEIREFMHPRVEEICDMLPASFAKVILNVSPLYNIVKFLLGKGRRVSTTKLRGFLPLYLIALLRPIRPISYRYNVEQMRIDSWLAAALKNAKANYNLGVAVAMMQRLIKGYGDTHQRGLANFDRIMMALPAIKMEEDPGGAVATLVEAALADEEGAALQAALKAFPTPDTHAA